MTISKLTVIDAIVAASYVPPSKIVPAIRLEAPDGKQYLIGGIPHGVDRSTLKTVQIGYVWETPEGTTVGKLGATEQELLDRHAVYQEENAAKFREQLNAMSERELLTQEAFWCGTQNGQPIEEILGLRYPLGSEIKIPYTGLKAKVSRTAYRVRQTFFIEAIPIGKRKPVMIDSRDLTKARKIL